MNPNTTLTRLLTDKAALGTARIDSLPLAPLKDGEALLRIDRVAVTTNNITYAAFGEAMQYWGFFPTGVEGWGHMPVWGFADVVASTVPGVEVGERFYGYFPLASHLRVQPVRNTPRGFYDGAPHRAELVSAYNQYTRCANDQVYAKALENYQMLLRPLVITSFFCADFLGDNAFFGARQVLLSSASSKTAYGTAFCLKDAQGIELIGLTSKRNQAFVESLGCYHRVVTYDDLSSIDPGIATTYVDYAGDEALREKVHYHFGAALAYDCYAGSAQNTNYFRPQALPGPAPQFYFAPVQIAKRNKDWGYDGVNLRFGEAQRAFIAKVSAGDTPWLRVVEHHGLTAATELVASMAAGRIDPQAGHVVVL